MPDAAYWIDRLQLQRHPEGGYFRETYRAPLTIAQAALPSSYPGDRSASTAIYFLLTRGEISALHRITADEGWHLYSGGPLWVHVIEPDGEHRRITLGLDLDAGQAPQAVVPGGRWFGSELDPDSPHDHALVGCTVAPGFDFDDFELATRNDLIRTYPQHEKLITRLTLEET